MTDKITSLEHARESLDGDHFFEALHHLIHTYDGQRTTILLDFLMNKQGRSRKDAEELLSILYSRFDKENPWKYFAYFERLGIKPTFACLMVVLQKATTQEKQEFRLWKEQQAVTTVYLIEDEIGLNLLLNIIIVKLTNLLFSGSALDFPQSLEAEILSPDILVVDYMVPGADGIEMIRHYHLRLPDSILVLRSYKYEDPDFVKEAIDAGADEVINYGPTSPQEFADLLNRYRDMHQTKLSKQ